MVFLVLSRKTRQYLEKAPLTAQGGSKFIKCVGYPTSFNMEPEKIHEMSGALQLSILCDHVVKDKKFGI